MKVAQSCPTLCDRMDYTVHGILQATILEWVAVLFSRASSQPRDPIQISCTAGDSLPAEPLGKPKNTGVGRLSLLQQIFPTQESNRGLLHCRWIRTTWATREAQYVNSGILTIIMIITTIFTITIITIIISSVPLETAWWPYLVQLHNQHLFLNHSSFLIYIHLYLWTT